MPIEFRTTQPPLHHQGMLYHGRSVLLIGSCFTQNVGSRLRDDLFDVTVNPTGTLYNPLSIAEALDRLLDRHYYQPDDLFNYLGLWRCLDHHSSFASSDPDVALSAINDGITVGADALAGAAALVVTWGNSTAYVDKATGRVVANCHKLPADRFEVESVTAARIVERWSGVVERVRAVNPGIELIYTVSPIRHKAYGLAGNALNKARLIEAAHAMVEADSRSVYFPAFEIMMDDLRDYRFYAADMIHPSEVACDYIYDTFLASFCDKATIEVAQASRRLTRRMAHRVMSDNPDVIAESRRQLSTVITEHLSMYPQTGHALNRLTNDL